MLPARIVSLLDRFDLMLTIGFVFRDAREIP
jgi:hypothetical protein